MSIHSDSYEKHKNLKLAACELSIPWQTLYVKLKKEGVNVTGDKSRHGSSGDKLAAMAEGEFSKIAPFAKNMNEKMYQSPHDFEIGDLKIDVKCSMPRILNKKSSSKSWSFSIKKQTFTCDFICCFCKKDDKSTEKILMIPREFFEGIQTISVGCNGKSKWFDYEISKPDLHSFLDSYL